MWMTRLGARPSCMVGIWVGVNAKDVDHGKFKAAPSETNMHKLACQHGAALFLTKPSQSLTLLGLPSLGVNGFVNRLPSDATGTSDFLGFYCPRCLQAFCLSPSRLNFSSLTPHKCQVFQHANDKTLLSCFSHPWTSRRTCCGKIGIPRLKHEPPSTNTAFT